MAAFCLILFTSNSFAQNSSNINKNTNLEIAISSWSFNRRSSSMCFFIFVLVGETSGGVYIYDYTGRWYAKSSVTCDLVPE